MSTYEHKIIEEANAKCDRLYIAEIIFAASALILTLLFGITWDYRLGIASSFMFATAIGFEIDEEIVRHRAYSRVNKRLKTLNKSMRKAVEGIRTDNVGEEIRQLNEEYAFLFISFEPDRIIRQPGSSRKYDYLYEETDDERNHAQTRFQ